MIPTRSAVCWTSSSEWDERKTVRPSAAVSRNSVAHLRLQQRVEPTRRLVEHGELGPVHERLHDPDLLPVAARQLPDRAVEHDPEPLAERVAQRRSGAAQADERVELLPRGEPVGQPQVAGQVADPTAAATPSRRLSRPKSAALPAVGLIRSSSSLIVVLLPAPFGPR